jgi:choline dehydrogenase-like flavoprotein
MIAAMAKSHTQILEAAGAVEISVHPSVAGNSSHYLGTCRMGKEAATSVVDPWCRTHDVPNLFVGDGSVFVTGAAVNPALTISALATRTADGMIEAFRRGDLP